MASPPDLLDGLNPQQQAVLTHDFQRQGPLLVLAGAGTGKTATLTRRLALELSRGAGPREILALTFTRKAASEMRERTARLLDGDHARVPAIRTFHSLGARILGEQGGRGWRASGWRGTPRLLEGESELAFRARFWKDRFRRDPAPALSARGQTLLQSEWGTPGFLEERHPDHPHLDAWRQWEDRKRREGVAEMSDLVAGALTALEVDEEMRMVWRARSRVLLVDEYQDTDRTQYRLTALLAGDSPCLMAVGDDDQSIYGFRGADIRNVLDWARDRPSGRILSLTTNYRCVAPILDLSNRLFPDKELRFRKILEAGRSAVPHAKPVWRRCRDEPEEGAWIAAQIASRIASGTLAAHEACVLFRSNRQEGTLRRALASLPQSPDGEGEGVRFLTIHAAKGLEWPLVAVAGQDVPASERTGILPPAQDEERRLFYVACTRARDTLLISSCRRRGGEGGDRRPAPWMRLASPGAHRTPSWLRGLWNAISWEARERSLREITTGSGA